MADLFTLDATTQATIAAALDSLISQFGKDCLLVYPPRWQPCANCRYDPIGQKSSNIWRTGGPMPFAPGTTCPMCGGRGQSANEASTIVHWKIEWEPRKFWYPVKGVDLRVPHSVCQTKGFMTDVPKVQQAAYIVLQLPIQGILEAKFRLVGQPISPGNIIQNRYFVATWEQFG